MKKLIYFNEIELPLRSKIEKKFTDPISIGDMIEFLYSHTDVIIECEPRESQLMGWKVNNKYNLSLHKALLEAVKEILK